METKTDGELIRKTGVVVMRIGKSGVKIKDPTGRL